MNRFYLSAAISFTIGHIAAGAAYAAATGSTESMLGITGGDACGDGEVVLIEKKNTKINIAPIIYYAFIDKKFGVSVRISPTNILSVFDKSPETAELISKFSAMIVPSLCLLRSVPESYRRLATNNNGSRLAFIRNITIGRKLASSYNSLRGIIEIGREKFSEKTFREGEPYNLYNLISWAASLAHETQHKEQYRSGITDAFGAPVFNKYFFETEFHAILYSLRFLELLPERLRGKDGLYAEAVLRHKRMIHKNSMAGKWYDSTRSARFNICRFEEHFFEKEFEHSGFKRDLMCKDVETEPPAVEIPPDQEVHNEHFDSMLKGLMGR